MNEDSSVKKGDSFEKKTFDLLQILLENDDFFVSGKKSKIFRKKGYYSEKRKSNIVFDITIETYLKGSTDYSLLTIIECKNYASAVPINDVEEFDSKIRQISEHNTKGVIVSNNSFQEGSYNFALANGIGLIRVTSDDEYEWIVRRKANSAFTLNNTDIANKFKDEKFDAENNFFAHIEGKSFFNLSDLLIQLGIIDYFNHKEKFINIPFVSGARIDAIVGRLIKNQVYSGKKLDENKLCDFLKTVYPVVFEFDSQLENNVLGKITFDPLKITVSNTLSNDIYRWRFTLAHEIGHLILHYKLLKNKLSEKLDTDISLSFQYNISEMTSRRLEFQANFFASHLLLPASTIINVVNEYFLEERISKRFLYWDHQPINQQLVLVLLNKISNQYQVSIEVVRIRLISLGLLVDDRFKSIREVLKELKFR